MMGQQGGGQDRLFYSFNLEDHIPPTHLLRGIDQFLDLRITGCRGPKTAILFRRVKQLPWCEPVYEFWSKKTRSNIPTNSCNVASALAIT